MCRPIDINSIGSEESDASPGSSLKVLRATDVATEANVIEMPSPQMTEQLVDGVRGLPVLAVCVGLMLAGAALLARGLGAGGVAREVGVLLIVLGAMASTGLTTVVPGEARVVQLFGRYRGTIRTSGLR